MSYNLTFQDSANTTGQYAKGIIQALEGHPFIWFCVLGWLSVFFISKSLGGDNGTNWVISSFVFTLISALGFFAEYIGWTVPLIFLVLTIGGLVYKGFSS